MVGSSSIDIKYYVFININVEIDRPLTCAPPSALAKHLPTNTLQDTQKEKQQPKAANKNKQASRGKKEAKNKARGIKSWKIIFFDSHNHDIGQKNKQSLWPYLE